MKKNSKYKYLLTTLFLITIFFAGCSSTSYDNGKNIVEASKVAEEYLSGNVKIIDARSFEEYEKGHLKGAISLSPKELSKDVPVTGILESKEDVEKVLSKKGIKNEDVIYIYDDNNGVFSSRLWWTLKIYGHENVKVINNGAVALQKKGLEMSLDVPKFEKSNYKALERNESMITYFEEVKDQVENPKENTFLIDVRTLAEYDEGSIGGSIFYNYVNNLYNDGSFKSERDIYLNYNDLGIERDDTIILYCKTSFRATQTMLLLNEAGFENVKVYDGAWLEWVNFDMPSEVKIESEILTEQDAS